MAPPDSKKTNQSRSSSPDPDPLHHQTLPRRRPPLQSPASPDSSRSATPSLSVYRSGAPRRSPPRPLQWLGTDVSSLVHLPRLLEPDPPPAPASLLHAHNIDISNLPPSRQASPPTVTREEILEGIEETGRLLASARDGRARGRVHGTWSPDQQALPLNRRRHLSLLLSPDPITSCSTSSNALHLLKQERRGRN
jgi:hypothetical protein